MDTSIPVSNPDISSMSSTSPIAIQPVVQVVGQSTDSFIGQEDVLQDGGIRYLVRRQLVGHQDMEDYNFTHLFDSKETTGDVTVICTNKSADLELFFVKAHKHVLVKSCSFFQHYFEAFLGNHSMPTLLIPNVHASTMHQWLQLFYTNQVILKFEDMVSFWSAAEIFKVEHVEPIYKWVYYIETLQPVISDNSPGSVPTTAHLETLLPLHAATGNETKSSPTDGQTETEQQQQAAAIIQQVVPVTVSISSESSQELPVFILRALTAPSQVSLSNPTTSAVDPLSPVILLSDNQQVQSTDHLNMAQSSPTAGDIAMAMLSANPEQRCRLVYDIQGNSSEKAEQAVIMSSSSSSQMSPRPFLIPQTVGKAMVMCPACLLVLNQENFADHKLICKEYKGSYSSVIHVSNPQPPPSPPSLPPPTSPPLKVFSCSVCNKTFASLKGLKAHLPFHNKLNKASKPPTPVSSEQSDSTLTSPVPPKIKKPSFTVPLKKGLPPKEKHRPVSSSSLSSPPDSHQ